MKIMEIFDHIAECEARLPPHVERGMEAERQRTSPEKQRLIGEIVGFLLPGARTRERRGEA